MKRKIEIRCYYEIPEDASVQQRWLLNILNESQMNSSELANKIHTSRQTLSCLINNKWPISFQYICAIIWATGFKENPETIYELIKKDRKRNTA